MYKALITIVFLAACFAAGCNSAGSISEKAAPGGDAPVAIEGYDTVAYFAAEKAAKGSQQFAFVWNGAKWVFSNQENLDKFKKEPEKYVPQFEGYCPVSLTTGGNEKGDPKVWRVVKNRLYVFYNEAYAKRFDENPDGYIDLAEKSDKPK